MNISIKNFAVSVADDLQITDEDMERLKQGFVPDMWSNTILDQLQIQYDFEEQLIKELTK